MEGERERLRERGEGEMERERGIGRYRGERTISCLSDCLQSLDPFDNFRLSR